MNDPNKMRTMRTMGAQAVGAARDIMTGRADPMKAAEIAMRQNPGRGAGMSAERMQERDMRTQERDARKAAPRGLLSPASDRMRRMRHGG